MKNKFTEVMSRKSDEELIEIVTKKKHEFQDDAIEAAIQNLKLRGIQIGSNEGAKKSNNQSQSRTAESKPIKLGKEFKSLLSMYLDKNREGALAQLAVFTISAGVLFICSIVYSTWIFALPGIFFLAIYFLRPNPSKKPAEYWIDLIEQAPSNIVWIKPVHIKRRYMGVLTIDEEKNFQLINTQEEYVIIKFKDSTDQRLFFNGIEKYLPHVQVGYSAQVSEIFHQNPTDFIENLKRKNLHTPISAYRR